MTSQGVTAHKSLQQTSVRGRIPGLDTLRCLAILGVILTHYPKAPGQRIFRALARDGWCGVDLFFVLSGYLIAGQLFALIARDRPISITNFYYRRALRILPNYYVVLLCYVLAATLRGEHFAQLWRYLTFVQNFSMPDPFGQSWSLCVEQHFYLVFPIVLLATRFRPRTAVTLVVLILAAEVVVRYAIWSSLRPALAGHTHESWDEFSREIYYPTYTRLDGITCGVALAAVERFRKTAWLRLMGLGNWLLVPAGALLGFALVTLRNELGLFYCVLSFSILSIGFTFLVAAALAPGGMLGRIRLPGVETLALYSYAIYLTHLPALEAADRLNKLARFPPFGAGAAFTSCVVIVAFGAGLFHGVERTFLKKRDRANHALEKAH